MSHYSNTKKRIVSELSRRATPAEKRLRYLLTKNGIRFVFQRPFTLQPIVRKVRGNQTVVEAPQRFYVADFFLPDSGVIIELDGSVHNGREHQDNKRSLDLIQNRKMIKHVLRFTNKDVFYDSTRIIGLILNILPIRLCKLDKQQKQAHKQNNAKISRLNEIEAIIKADTETPWATKKQLLNQLNHD